MWPRNFDAEAVLAVEQKWDTRLGGPATRPNRELVCFCLGRLLARGAQPADVVGYLGAVLDVLDRMDRSGPVEGAS